MPYKTKENRLRARREYYERNKEKEIARMRVWRLANPENVRKIRRKNHFSQYGITLETVDEMMISQENKCAVCGDYLSSPCVDHDHSSGKVRQLVCSPCNKALGFLRDSASIAEKAAAYLRKHESTQEASSELPSA